MNEQCFIICQSVLHIHCAMTLISSCRETKRSKDTKKKKKKKKEKQKKREKSGEVFKGSSLCLL